MSSARTDLERKEGLLLLAMAAAVFAWLLHRNLGLYPAIFADEWYYSKMSRLMPLSDAMVPSYLYLWLFRSSNACGAGFLDCVRIGNALFFVGAAPFVYLVARRFTTQALAWLVTLAALLAPLNMYTAFFMPESMYWFGFWVLSWSALCLDGWPWRRHALAAGLVLGLMSLVKVHALFLLPALALFLLYARRAVNGDGPWLRTGLLAGGFAVLAFFAVKFGLGYLFAGKAAFSLFGPLYAGTASAGTQHSVPDLLGPAFISARGHAMALAVLLAFPLALLAQMLGSRAARRQAGAGLATLQVYALLMLAAAAGMTVLYTASVAHAGPHEGLRLHQRYYSFVFPLLLIVAAATPGQRARSVRAWPVALLLGTVLAIALVKLPHYAILSMDGPDIAALDMRGPAGRLVAGLDLVILFLWALGSRLAAPLFLFVALPALLWPQMLSTGAYLRQLVPGIGPDNAGLAARRLVPPSERGRIAVAGSEEAEIMRSQFHIDDKDTATLKLAPGAPVEPNRIPARSTWLLVLGQHRLPDDIEPLIANQDYALARLGAAAPPIGTAVFSQPIGPGGLLAGASGLSTAESWGRWSIGERVVLRFNAPFPPHVDVMLKAQAFDGNAGQPFTARIGTHVTTFTLGKEMQELRLPMDAGYNERTLVITVPHAVSPAELGQSPDRRRLGIGIAELGIAPARTAPAASERVATH